MYVTITSNRTVPEQAPRVEAFLRDFLPRLRKHPGVRGVYHFLRPDHGDDMTIIIWDDQGAVKAYRTSDLMRKVSAFEQSLGTSASRAGYPLAIALI